MNRSVNQIEQKVDALEDFIGRKERLRREAPLRYLFWEATLRCNLQCLHCGSDCVRDDAASDLEIDADMVKRELRAIAAQYPPERITVAIIGGEPLVRDDIFAVGAFAAGLGYNWGITTNGMLLNDERIRRLKESGLKTISVSLDGVAADHDALRDRPGSHRVVTGAIERLVANPFYEKFDVICCVSKINVGRLEEFLEDLIGMGVPAVRFAPVFSRGRAAVNPHLALGREDTLALLDFVSRQRRLRDKIGINLSEEGYWGPEWECEVRDRFHYCASGITVGTILHDGGVTGCPSVSRKFIEGNIKDAPFADIWRQGFKRYRRGRKESFAHVCGDCEHWDLCEGGGFHLLDQPGDAAVACSLDRIGGREKHGRRE